MTFSVWLVVAASLDVHVTAAPCVGVEAIEVQRIVALELGQEFAAPSAGRQVNAHLECSGELVDIVVDDSSAPRPLVRRLALATVDPAARTRTAALAITELIAASWNEAVHGVDPPVPAAKPPPPQLRLSAIASGRLVSSTVQLGGGLRVRGLLPNARLGMFFEANFDQGTTRLTVGSVDLKTVSGALAGTFTFSFDRFELIPALGFRVGYANALGLANDGASTAASAVGGAWVGPLAALGASFDVLHLGSATLHATAQLEAGYTVVGVRALSDGRAVSGVEGPWGGLTVGIELRL